MTAFSEQYGRVCGRKKQPLCINGHDTSQPGSRSNSNACRRCAAARTKQYRKEDPKRFALYRRAQGLRDCYGISLEQYDDLWIEQAGMCAICHTTNPLGAGKEFAVDHDHATGKVRGLLCQLCNQGIGHFKDSPALLRTGATYLEQQV
jgi:hypothetical protein